jgi:hypothetical protein
VKKAFLFLASRQKIPVLRTENLAVNTRTICLLPIEFFKIPHARKATAGKSRPEATGTAGKSRPSVPWRETFYIPMPGKVKAGKPQQATTDAARKSRGQKEQKRPENPGQ